MVKSPCGKSKKVVFLVLDIGRCSVRFNQWCVVGVGAGLRLSMPSGKGMGYCSGKDDVQDHVRWRGRPRDIVCNE